MHGDGDDPIQLQFHASYRRLVGQLYGVCGDLAEAEDVVAEAFVKAVSHRRTFEALGNPEAWLRTVAVNLARSRHRRRRLGEQLVGRSVQREPDPRLDLSDDRLTLVTALRALPHAQREVLALHYLADLPVAVIAETIGAPEGTVKTRLSRGRAAMGALLQHERVLADGGAHE